MLPPSKSLTYLFNKAALFRGALGRNLNQSKPKKIFAIIILFATIGLGGVIAATSIAINSGSQVSLGAGYTTATTCDANVTLKAKTALDASSGQLYVSAFELSDISQNATTGCGNKTMEMALKINGQMTYASWDIPASGADSTFYFTGVTSSISDYNAMTALAPFQADGLTNIAIGKIGSFQSTFVWEERSPVNALTTRGWDGIASSSDGTKLVAVDYGSDVAGGYIYTSIDSGATWTRRTSAGAQNWYPITSSSDGTRLAAAVGGWDGGYIYTSSDSGVNWYTNDGSSGINYWNSITSSSDGRKLAAGTWDDYIYTSDDYGVTWTKRTSAGTRVWYSITSSSDGTNLAVVDQGTGSGGYIYTSTDSGSTWAQRSPVTPLTPRDWLFITSSADGTKLVAGENDGYIYTSTDSGSTWTQRSPVTASTPRKWESIASSSDGINLAAVARGGYIYTSSDSGVTWTIQTGTSPRNWVGITSSSNGSKLAAIVMPGYIYTAVIGKTRSNS